MNQDPRKALKTSILEPDAMLTMLKIRSSPINIIIIIHDQARSHHHGHHTSSSSSSMMMVIPFILPISLHVVAHILQNEWQKGRALHFLPLFILVSEV